MRADLSVSTKRRKDEEIKKKKKKRRKDELLQLKPLQIPNGNPTKCMLRTLDGKNKKNLTKTSNGKMLG